MQQVPGGNSQHFKTGFELLDREDLVLSGYGVDSFHRFTPSLKFESLLSPHEDHPRKAGRSLAALGWEKRAAYLVSLHRNAAPDRVNAFKHLTQSSSRTHDAP